MKLKRIASAIILLVILFTILIFGNTIAVNLMVSTVAILAVNEYFNNFKQKKNVDRWIGNILAISIAFIEWIPLNILIIAFPVVIILLFIKVVFTQMKTNFEDIVFSAFGIFYIIGFLIFLPLLFRAENGRILIWYLAIAAWGTDTFAYVIGMKFGKHKFTSISPNKSIEGAIGGVVGAAILALIYTYFINKFADLQISYLLITGVIVLLSILSQIGDLAASSIKRFIGIKDFSNLIPGHGGMLDRIDSILFIAPIAYILLMLV